MKTAFLAVLAAAALVSTASAQIVATESFAGFDTAVAIGSRTSTVGGGSWVEVYPGPPDVSSANNDATDFPFANSDDRYMLLAGGVAANSQAVRVAISPALANTATTVQFTFAVKILAADATAANNDLEIISVSDSTVGSGNPLVNVRLLNGNLVVGDWNGYETTPLTIAASVADLSNATGNWITGSDAGATSWKLVAVRATLAAAAGGSTEVRVYNVSSGAPIFTASNTGFTHTRVSTGIDRITFGDVAEVPTNSSLSVAVDDVRIYSNAVSSTDFFNQASAFALSSVNEWSMFQ